MNRRLVGIATKGFTALTLVGLCAVSVSVVYLPESNGGSQSGDLVAMSGSVFTVEIDTSETRLACPPGLADPNDLDKAPTSSTVWLSREVAETPLVGSGSAIVPGEIDSSMEFPEALAFAGSVSGDFRSLLVENCLVPRNRLTVVAGATTIAQDTVLTISNPSGKPVRVGIHGFGATGALGSIPEPLTIPPGTTESWIPGVWFPDEPRLALSIEADGQGVSAWVQSSGREGEVTTGLGRLGAKPVSTVNVLSGISESSGIPSLNLLNPTEKALSVKVEISESDGQRVLPGTEKLQIAPGAVFQLSLAGIGEAPVSIIATASEPFSASINYQIVGKEDPVVKGQNVSARTLVGPGSSAVQFHPPAVADLEKIIVGQGFTNAQFSFILTNANPKEVNLKSGPVSIQVAPGTTVVVDQEDWAQMTGPVTSDFPLFATLLVTAQSEQGPVQALAEIGFGGFEAAQQVVSLTH